MSDRNKDPSLIVLKYLLNGGEVQFEGHTYASRDGNIVILLTFNSQTASSHVRAVDPCLTINQFLHMCDTFSEADLMGFSAVNVGHEMVKKRG